MSGRFVHLGEVLQQVDCSVQVSSSTTYKMLGVRSFGRGAFAANDLLGGDTMYPRLRRLRSGMLVYPKLMAWEGAFAVVPEGLDGRHASPEFVAFTPLPDLDAKYLAHFVSWRGFREALMEMSTGTNARRRRLQPEQLLSQRVWLPGLGSQRRIATHLDEMARSTGEIDRLRIRLDARETMRQAAREVLEPLSDRWKVGFDIDIFGGGTPVDLTESEGSVTWATPTDLGPLVGRTLSVTNRRVQESFVPRRGLIPRGSVVMTSRAPIGNLAIAGVDLLTNQGCKSFVPRVDVDPRFLYFSVMSRFDDYAAAGSGTTFQEVSAARIKTVALPAAPLVQQHRLADHLARIEDALWQLAHLQKRSTALHDSLLPAARNDVFSSLH